MAGFFDFHRGQTVEEAQAQINVDLNKVITQATIQAADGCLDKDAPTDKTKLMSAKDTVLYTDTDRLGEGGNKKPAEQTESFQSQLISKRREANISFDAALATLTPRDRDDAIRTMNLVKEQIFSDELNKRGAHSVDSPESLKNSIAEQRVSEAKTLFAAQIKNGDFLEKITAYAGNGIQVQCVHQNADVIDYSH